MTKHYCELYRGLQNVAKIDCVYCQFDEVNMIIEDQYFYGHEGGFLQSFFFTWKKADPSNQQLLSSTALALIKKYKLTRLTKDDPIQSSKIPLQIE